MNDLPEKSMEQESAERPKERSEILPLPPPPPLPSLIQQTDGDVAEHPDFVPFRPPRREHFMPWLALLSSQRIPYRVEFEGSEPLILVPWDWAERAEREFSIYEARHVDWPPPEETPQEKEAVAARPLVTDEAFCVFLLFPVVFCVVVSFLPVGWRKFGRHEPLA